MSKVVLFLHRGGDQIRGTEEALLVLLRSLDRREFIPIVVHSNGVLAGPLEELGVESYHESFPELLVTLGEQRFPLVQYLRRLRWLTRLCRERGVALVVCNGGGPCQLGVPLGRLVRVPVLGLFHHPAPASYLRYWLVDRVHMLVFASSFTEGDTRGKIEVLRSEVIHVGIDARERFVPVAARDPALRRGLGFDGADVVFAQVGALVPHKAHAVLLEAFARVVAGLPTARLLVVGAGPEEAGLRRLCTTLALETHVRFTGFVDDVLPYLQHVIDVNVLASREEGLGLVNLQASACEIPNIASDCTGIRETIVDGRTGYLCAVDDPAAFADAMLRLGAKPDLRRGLGVRGRQHVLEAFLSETYAARMQGAMRELIVSGL